MNNKEILSKALFLISSYYNMLDEEKKYCEQNHNKIKFVHCVSEQCKIDEVRKELTRLINIEDMTQDGIKVFIGNCELPFIINGLEKAIQKPTWAANVGEIRTLNKLSMTLKSI